MMCVTSHDEEHISLVNTNIGHVLKMSILVHTKKIFFSTFLNQGFIGRVLRQWVASRNSTITSLGFRAISIN